MTRKIRSAKQRRLDNIRRGLKYLLGARCAICGERRLASLEIDHVDACTWVQKGVNTSTRWYRYLREYREGVRLRLLCRTCNGAENQYTHGTHEERKSRNVTSLRSMRVREAATQPPTGVEVAT